MPVALATIVCSNETFEPSAKLVTIVGFCPHFSANPFWVVGFRYRSCKPLIFPITRGMRPRPLTYRYRLISTPGWSPSQAERMTPAFLAYTCRIGPIVASSSAFIRITCLPCSNASIDHVRAELDRSGHVHQRIDLGRAGQECPILGDGGAVARDRFLELRSCVSTVTGSTPA